MELVAFLYEFDFQYLYGVMKKSLTRNPPLCFLRHIKQLERYSFLDDIIVSIAREICKGKGKSEAAASAGRERACSVDHVAPKLRAGSGIGIHFQFSGAEAPISLPMGEDKIIASFYDLIWHPSVDDPKFGLQSSTLVLFTKEFIHARQRSQAERVAADGDVPPSASHKRESPRGKGRAHFAEGERSGKK